VHLYDETTIQVLSKHVRTEILFPLPRIIERIQGPRVS
jgi:hypothetical protein